MPKPKTADEMEALDATKIVDLVETSESKEDLVIEPIEKTPVYVTTAQEIVVNKSVTKNVRIKTFEKVDCVVGGVPYKLDKDKEALVPSDVAAILVTSKKAYRL